MGGGGGLQQRRHAAASVCVRCNACPAQPSGRSSCPAQPHTQLRIVYSEASMLVSCSSLTWQKPGSLAACAYSVAEEQGCGTDLGAAHAGMLCRAAVCVGVVRVRDTSVCGEDTRVEWMMRLEYTQDGSGGSVGLLEASHKASRSGSVRVVLSSADQGGVC